MTKLPAEEREVWKEAYVLYEKHHDMPFTGNAWIALCEDLSRMCSNHSGKPYRMALALGRAMIDWIETEQKTEEEAARNAPEQVAMEGVIPWT